MKKIIIYLVLAVVALCTGCKMNGAKKMESGGSNVADANKIIDYTNAILEVVKKYNEAAENAVKYYGQLEDKINGKNVYPFRTADIQFLWTAKKEAAKAFATPTDAFENNDKKFFADSMAAYHKIFDEFANNDSTLGAYIKAEDFKDDKYAKGKTLIDKQFILYPQLVSLRISLSDRIDKVADAAEDIALKDSPIKDAYIATKGDLGKVKSLVNKIADKETYTDVELSAIDAGYTALLASIEKNKGINPVNLQKENKIISFNNFYKFLTDEVLAIKPIIRTIKETKKLTENDYQKIGDIYKRVISDYNSWVK